MGVPTSEVGYTSAMPRRKDHEVHKAMWGIGNIYIYIDGFLIGYSKQPHEIYILPIKEFSRLFLTKHHSFSWIKRDQLDATCFITTLFSAQHVSDVNTSILRSLRLIRWVTSWVVSGSKCVMLQCGYGVVVVLQPAYGYHTTIATLQHNNTLRTRYNPWSNSTN